MSLVTSLPIIGGGFDNSQDEAMAQLRRNQALYENLKTPDLKWDTYTPKALTNESADYQLTQDDPITKSAQLAALSKLSGLSDTGLSEADQAGFAEARGQGDQMAKAGTDAAMANAAARGVGGSGLEFAAREAATQAGATRANQAGLQQAATAAQQRAMYNQAYGNQLSNVRSQDYTSDKNNADTVNKFNAANTSARNQTNQTNTNNENAAFLTNQNGRNATAQQGFNNDVTKIGGQAQANTGMAQGYAAENAANTADRNTWTQIGATALMPGAKKQVT